MVSVTHSVIYLVQLMRMKRQKFILNIALQNPFLRSEENQEYAVTWNNSHANSSLIYAELGVLYI